MEGKKRYYYVAILLLFVIGLSTFLFAFSSVNVSADDSAISIEFGKDDGIDRSSSSYVITGDTVSTTAEEVNGDVKVTPHTLTDSGWVTVEYYSKLLTGNVDVSFGFDGKYDIKPTKVESWESYAHNKTRLVDAVVEATFPATKPVGMPVGMSFPQPKITSVRLLDELPKEETVAIGDRDLNGNFAYVEYEMATPISKEPVVKTDIIAYTTYDEKTSIFTYRYNGKVVEPYTETYEDWKPSNNIANKSTDTLSGTSDWKSLEAPQSVKLNEWTKIRFWIDLPFDGFRTVTGKYNIAIKPSGISLTDAKAQDKLIIIDPWYNASWLYSKSITLSRASGAVTNYPLRLLVAENSTAPSGGVACMGHCKSDFSDLRFTNSDNTTVLDYWIETNTITGTTPNQVATVWIEFNSIGTGATTFYMYYGNLGATTTSNGNTTFSYFDDFIGVAIDGSKTYSYGTVTVSGGNVTVAGNSGIGSNANFGVNYRNRSRVATTNVTTEIALLHYDIDGTHHISWKADQWETKYQAISKNGGVTRDNVTAVALDINYHVFEILRNNNVNTTFILDGVSEDSAGLAPTGSTNLSFGTQTSDICVVDWVFVSQYLNPEPAWGSWGSEAIDITNSPTSKAFGIVAESSTFYAKGSAPSNPVTDGECTYTVTNAGSAPIDISVKGTNFTGGVGWTLASSVGSNQVKITAYYSGQNPASGVVLTTSNQAFISNLLATATKKWDFRLDTGTFTDGVGKSGTITLTSTAH